MSSAPGSSATQLLAARAAAAARTLRAPVPGFHLGLALLMTVIVLLGFWPFYAGLSRAAPARTR